MITTNCPQYGHFLVRKAYVTEPILGFGYSLNLCSISNETAYGVFKINHARHSYDNPENTEVLKSFKIDLEPMSSEHFVRRDWYTSSVLSKYDIDNGTAYVFDNYEEALKFANEKNKEEQ